MNGSHRRARAFTLVEILVVVSIIGLLVGLSVPAVGGALASARKAKVTAMAHQIRTALLQFNTEYGYFPTNGINALTGMGTTASQLTLILSGSSNALATNANPRRIAFLEVPNDFTQNGSGDPTARGLVTPLRFYKTGQSNLNISVDADYDGRITVTNDTAQAVINGSVAVWFVDPSNPRKTIGTWK